MPVPVPPRWGKPLRSFEKVTNSLADLAKGGNTALALYRDADMDRGLVVSSGERIFEGPFEKAAARYNAAMRSWWTRTYDGAEPPASKLYKAGEAFREITSRDVGTPLIQAFGRQWLVHNFMGNIQVGDVGKRIYLRGGILQVENDAQFKARTYDGAEPPASKLYKSVAKAGKFKPGDKVYHKKYGTGTVDNTSAGPRGDQISVLFDNPVQRMAGVMPVDASALSPARVVGGDSTKPQGYIVGRKSARPEPPASKLYKASNDELNQLVRAGLIRITSGDSYRNQSFETMDGRLKFSTSGGGGYGSGKSKTYTVTVDGRELKRTSDLDTAYAAALNWVRDNPPSAKAARPAMRKAGGINRYDTAMSILRQHGAVTLDRESWEGIVAQMGFPQDKIEYLKERNPPGSDYTVRLADNGETMRVRPDDGRGYGAQDRFAPSAKAARTTTRKITRR